MIEERRFPESNSLEYLLDIHRYRNESKMSNNNTNSPGSMSQVSYLDLDDLLNDAGHFPGPGPQVPPKATTGSSKNTFVDGLPPSFNPKTNYNTDYHVPGSMVPVEAMSNFFKTILDQGNRFAGKGSHNNVFQNFVSRLDRMGGTLAPLNSLHKGYTFITRPRLNLTGANIHQDPVLTTLHSYNNRSVPFMIRMLLDTRISHPQGGSIYLGDSGDWFDPLPPEIAELNTLSRKSPLFDHQNPFFVPLCNGLKGVSGWPDFNLEVEQQDLDFHSGDFTYAKGSDFNNRTQELSLEFRDVQGSVILSSFYYWCLYMGLQAKGIVMPYPDDEWEQRLNYTVSIYRFITDPTKKHVLWWAKATGCFPKSVPVGALFNVNQDEVILSSAMNFSIPFTANDIKYNDPAILLDFNILMQRYCPSISNDSVFSTVDPYDQYENFNALPYISATENNGIQILWRTSKDYRDGDGNGMSSKELDTELAKATAERDAIMGRGTTGSTGELI